MFEILHLLCMLTIGMVVGLGNCAAVRKRERVTLLVILLVGMAGAVGAGILAEAVGWWREDPIAGVTASVAGSAVLVWVYKKGGKQQ
jgi:uncharacterized membrane protein YeaQ/YmgE (transglycosylase-associated protein family)